MSSNKKRINLSFSMSSPIQRRAWKKLTEIPAGQRTAAVCRMICEHREQRELLEAGDIDDDVLGFLASLQEGDDTT